MDEGGPLICLTGGAHNDAAGVLKLLEHAACGAGTESDFWERSWMARALSSLLLKK